MEKKPRTRTRRAPRWQVIGLNDDVTPMDYVVLLLIEVFNKDQEAAFRLMLEVHETGAGIFYVGTMEACELKVEQTQEMNRKYERKLMVRMEPIED